MRRLTSDRNICLYIYIFTLAITVSYAIWRQVIMSDQAIEYSLYLMSVADGQIHLPADNIVGSCLTVTIVPACIQRITHWDAELVFKIWPCVSYSIMPVFTYLISRKYMSKSYAILSSMIVLSSFYFMYYPANGRVSVALGLLAGMLWGVLGKHYIWALVFGAGVIFSHYGTTYIALLLLSSSAAYHLLRNWKEMDTRWLCSILFVLVMTTGIWHWGVAWESSRYTKGFILNGIESAKTALPNGGAEAPAIAEDKPGFYSLESRDIVVQQAFGKYWSVMSFKQRLELVLSWLFVLLISAGLLYALLKRKLSAEHRIMAVVMYCLLVLSTVVPYVSKAYGIIRVYFTALIVLAPLAAIITRESARRIKIHGEPVLAGMIGVYALCTSGVVTWLLDSWL